MNIDMPANDGELFVALISSALDGDRIEDDSEPFDTFDAARQWADEQLADNVDQHGSGPDFRADVARVDRDDFDDDFWDVTAANTVARATWDAATGSAVWRTDGPFDFGD